MVLWVSLLRYLGMTEHCSVEASGVVARRQDILSTELDGSLVLMSIELGQYFGVASTARRIWDLLEEPKTVPQLVDCLAREFQADEAVLRADVLDFVAQLKHHGLVEYR